MSATFVKTFKCKEKEFLLRFNFEIDNYAVDSAIWMFTAGLLS